MAARGESMLVVMWRLVSLAVLVACGTDTGLEVAPSAPVLPARLQLITDAQYRNAVRDLVGEVALDWLHSPGTSPHPFLHDDVLAVDAPLLVQYRIAAETVAAQVATAPARVGCAASDEACLRARSVALAERAFRRPLEADERAQLLGLFAQGAQGATPASGAALVLEAALQAPSFLYRDEVGALDGRGGRALSSYALASALAALLLDSIPDEALWQAARTGALVEPEVLAREVDRLLALPRVREHLVDVVLAWLEVPAVLSVTKDPALFPALTPALRASMYAETRAFVSDVLWRRGGQLRALLTSRETFVDGNLAALYGLEDAPSGFAAVELDAKRAGILTQASTLARLATDQRESIVRRGLFIDRKLLCLPEPGQPPAAIVAAATADLSMRSEAEVSRYRTDTEACAVCHAAIDPPGRALHAFDGLGRWRVTDDHDAPIDARAALVIDGRMRHFDGAAELGEALADSTQVARCVADQLTHFVLGREIDDAALRNYVYARFVRSDGDLIEVFRALAVAPAFRLREVAP